MGTLFNLTYACSETGRHFRFRRMGWKYEREDGEILDQGRMFTRYEFVRYDRANQVGATSPNGFRYRVNKRKNK
jgi:hypothetical protein